MPSDHPTTTTDSSTDRLLEIARAVSASTGGPYLRSLVSQAAGLLGADSLFVGELVAEAPDTVRTVAAWREGGPVADFSYRLSGSPCANVLAGDLCIHTTGIRRLFPGDALLEELQAEAYVGVPLRAAGGRALGLIVVIFTRALEDPRPVESMLRILATRASAELERMRSDEVLRGRVRFEALLSKLSAHFVGLPAEDVDREIDIALRAISEVMGVRRANVFQLSPDGTRLSATHDWCADGVLSIRPLVQDVPCSAFPWSTPGLLRGESLIIRDTNELPPEAAGERSKLDEIGVRSCVVTPLMVGGDVLGLVSVDAEETVRRWSDESVSRMRLVAEIFANAIQRKRAEEKLRERLALEALVSRLSTYFISLPAISIDAGISHALKSFGEFLGVDRSYVFQFSLDRLRYSCTHEWCAPGVPPMIDRLQEKDCEAMSWAMYRLFRRESLVVHRLDELPPEAARERREFVAQGIRSLVVAPFTVAGTIRGVVGLDMVREERSWPDEIVSWMKLVGEIMANALERKRAEETLHESRERFRGLVESTNDWVWETDAHLVYTYCSPSSLELLGYAPEELIGRTMFDIMPGEEATRLGQAVAGLAEATEPLVRLESVRLHRDGRRVVFETNAMPILDREGRLRGYRGIDRDISIRRQLQEEIRAHRERLSTFFALAPAGLAILDGELRYLQVNHVLAAMNGIPEDLHIGRRVEEVVPEQVAREVLPLLRRVIETGEPALDCEISGPGVMRAGDVHVVASYFPVTIEGRDAPGIGVVVVDITERKQAEARLHDYQERLRSLASEISLAEERERRRIAVDLHDRTVQNLGLCKLKLGALKESVSGASGEIETLRSLIEQTIQDTRSLVFELSPPILYDLGFEPAVDWLADRMEAQHGISCRVLDDGQIKPLDGDVQVALFQAVRELLNNVAKHARATRATVTLSRDDDLIRIVVQDDGIGFAAANVGARLSAGEGFGLFSIRDRLDLIGGRMEIAPTGGGGAQVALSAPLKVERIGKP